MNILVLGDIFGKSGSIAVKKHLPTLINEKKIDFVVANGENAADPGVGITKKNVEEFFNSGVDVITTGNHVWDQKETMEFIIQENRLLRPENLAEGSPGNGFGIFNSKNKKKVAVINLMGNVFMKKSRDVFESAKKISEKIKLGKDADFIVIDIHAEITSEKMAMGRIMKNGTAYQTDLGMCGDYDSVIGMNKDNSLKKFMKDPKAEKHFPAEGLATICGVMVYADEDTGLAKKILPIRVGGSLEERL